MSRSSRLAIVLALGTAMILMLVLGIVFVEGVSVVLAEDQPDGSIIISPQTTDGTWGPGTITAETDVVINAGVIITIAPGTTIRVADGMGFTVYGNLHSDGPVTFTGISGTPGAWKGITYAPDSNGYLNQATVEYAVHALTLDTLGPITITNSALRYNRHATTTNNDAFGAGLTIVRGDHLIEYTDVYSNSVETTYNGADVYGGGIDIQGGAPRLLHSRIYDNSASTSSSATRSHGGGGGILIRAGNPLIQYCEITSNTLYTRRQDYTYSGAGAGIGIYGNSGAEIRNNRIANNINTSRAAGGGGIGFRAGVSALIIDGNLIVGNAALTSGWYGEGGGIDDWGGSTFVAANNLIYNNTTNGEGGGIATWRQDNARVFNNTIVGNTASQGGGIYCGRGIYYNNVVAENTATGRGGGIYRSGGTVDYNDIFGNTAPTGADTYGSGFGSHNLSVDPSFLGTGDLVQRYHLSRGSLLIDAGTDSGTGLPGDDYDGDLRPLHDGWDIGFDEVAPTFAITKSAAPDPVGAGETLNYTIVIANVGQGDATGLTVSDPVPSNTAYVAGSSQVMLPVFQLETYGDEFASVAYDGSNGTIDWSSQPWSEIDDDGTPNGGDVRIVTDQGDYSIRIRFSGNGVMRRADLSTYTYAQLTFEYRRSGIDSGEYVFVQISNDGGSSWAELARFGSGTDSSYQAGDYDITDYMADNTTIRFLSSGLDSSDYFYVDNVQIEGAIDEISTGPGGDPPTLASGVTLNAGERMTVTYAVVVNDPLPGGVDDISNTVNVDCDQQIAAAETIVTAVDAAPDLTIAKDDGGAVVEPGDVIVYTLSYANDGTQDATGVVITEAVPDNTTFDATSSSAGWSCADGSPAGTVCTLSVTGLDVDDSGSAAFAVTVDNPLRGSVGYILNVASIADDGTNGDDLKPGDNQDEESTEMAGTAPALSIIKAGPDTADVGQTVVYTFTVSHASTSDGSPISTVTVNDDVAGAATQVSGDEDSDGLLEANETWVFAASYRIQSGDPNPLVNTGTVEGRDQEGDPIVASDTHRTSIGEAPPQETRLFLPVLVRSYSPSPPEAMPDLVVESVAVTRDDVQVVIVNQGDAPVVDDFWVDLYIDPDPVPTAVNQTWPQLCDEGLVWGVTEDLAPGATLTLTLSSPYFNTGYSNFGGTFTDGMDIYVQVDSANADTAYGAVLESHESAGEAYNNIEHVTVSLAAMDGVDIPVIESRSVPAGNLPTRP